MRTVYAMIPVGGLIGVSEEFKAHKHGRITADNDTSLTRNTFSATCVDLRNVKTPVYGLVGLK